MSKLITSHWTTLQPLSGRDFSSAEGARASFHQGHRWEAPCGENSKMVEVTKKDFAEGLWVNLVFDQLKDGSGWKRETITRVDKWKGVIQISGTNLTPFGGRDFNEDDKARDSFQSGHRWLAPIEGRWVEVTKRDFEPGIWVKLHWGKALDGWKKECWCLV